MLAFKRIISVFSKITFVLAVTSVIGILAMVFVEVADVLMRKLFAIGVRGTTEYASFALCISIFGAIAYTETENSHINVTLFVQMLPLKARYICLFFVNLLSAITVALMSYGMLAQGIKLARSTVRGMLTSIPYYPFYIFCGFCAAVFAIACLMSALKHLLALWDEELANEVRSTWI